MLDKAVAYWLRLQLIWRVLLTLLLFVLLLGSGWWGRYQRIWIELQQREQQLIAWQQEAVSLQRRLTQRASVMQLQAQRRQLQRFW